MASPASAFARLRDRPFAVCATLAAAVTCETICARVFYKSDITCIIVAKFQVSLEPGSG